MKDVIAAFTKHYQAGYSNLILTEPVDPKRIEELHPSSFPYCGLRHAYEQLKWGEPETRSLDLAGSYFTTIGTSVHLVMQNWLGKVHMHRKVKGAVLGNWHCPSCDKITAKAVTYTDCPACGSETEYSELEVKFGKRICGKLDGVYQILGKNYVFDYKTTSTYGVNDHKSRGNKYPYRGNRKQIEAYCVLLEQEYGIDVSGWVLAYLARDNPKYSYAIVGEEMTAAKKANTLKRMHIYDRHFELVRNINEKNLQTVMREKPCKSDAYYWQHMHDNFNPCPLSENGKCWSVNAEKNMLKML